MDIELLKINDFKKIEFEQEFYANTIPNHLNTHHSRIEKAHKHNFYAVFIFTKGKGSHEIDFQKYEVKPGAVFFLYPGQTHAWELSDDIDGYLFFHSEDFYEMAYVKNSIKDYPFFESNYTEKCIYLSTDQKKEIEFLFKKLYAETQHNEWKKNQLILSYLTQIYIQLNRFIEHHSTINYQDLRHYRKIFSSFEKLLDTQFKTTKSASEFADLLHISQKHLNRVVKSFTSKTTTDIITNRVMLEAKRLLIYTDNSLARIALQLGYEDYSYFSKLFKKVTGETASEFRKSYKEDKE